MAEKKGLIYKFIVGSDKNENYARSTLPSNRWELFWDILKGRFWKLVLLNLMLIAAVIPALYIFLVMYSKITSMGATLPFSDSLFVGYPFTPGLYDFMVYFEFMTGLYKYLLLIPCFIFAAVIMSGVFYIMRNLVWSEGVFIANDFWKGLKSNILQFLGIALLLGIVLFLANLNITSLNQASSLYPDNFISKPFLNNLFKGITYVFTVFFIIMAFFSLTIAVTYKVKFFQLIRNSFILTLGLLPRNIVFIILAFSPFILVYLLLSTPFVSILFVIILMLGLSCAVLVWTIYSHWVFDTFINEKVEGAVKNRGLYQKYSKEGKPVYKKSWFENPKKKKAIKPVTDEEVAITELPANYSRADLAKLAAEKELMKQDSEKWAKEHENDDPEAAEELSENGEDDVSAYEGYEDAMKLEGYEEGKDAEPESGNEEENPEEEEPKGEEKTKGGKGK